MLCLHNTHFFFQLAADPSALELPFVLQLINANTQLHTQAVSTISNSCFTVYIVLLTVHSVIPFHPIPVMMMGFENTGPIIVMGLPHSRDVVSVWTSQSPAEK